MSQAGFLLVKVLESCSTGADACLQMEKEMGEALSHRLVIHCKCTCDQTVSRRGES